MLQPASPEQCCPDGQIVNTWSHHAFDPGDFRRTAGISRAENWIAGGLIMGQHQRPRSLQHGVERDLIFSAPLLQCMRNVFF